jgi:hypothetical protein
LHQFDALGAPFGFVADLKIRFGAVENSRSNYVVTIGDLAACHAANMTIGPENLLRDDEATTRGPIRQGFISADIGTVRGLLLDPLSIGNVCSSSVCNGGKNHPVVAAFGKRE